MRSSRAAIDYIRLFCASTQMRPAIDRRAAVQDRRRDDDRRLPFVTTCACFQTLGLSPASGEYRPRQPPRSIAGRQFQSLRHRHFEIDVEDYPGPTAPSNAPMFAVLVVGAAS
jgi:hypothetical protein